MLQQMACLYCVGVDRASSSSVNRTRAVQLKIFVFMSIHSLSTTILRTMLFGRTQDTAPL